MALIHCEVLTWVFWLLPIINEFLNYIKPDYVHVMMDGRIVESGESDLALHLEEHGYDWIREKVNGN